MKNSMILLIGTVFDKVAKVKNIDFKILLYRLDLCNIFIDFIGYHGNILTSSSKGELKTLAFI